MPGSSADLCRGRYKGWRRRKVYRKLKVAPVLLLFHPYVSYQHCPRSSLDNLYTHSTTWVAIKAFPNKSQKKTTIMAIWIALTTTRPFDPCLRREVMVTIWRAERTPKATNNKRSSARPTAAHLREARKANSEAIKTAKAERTIRAGVRYGEQHMTSTENNN